MKSLITRIKIAIATAAFATLLSIAVVSVVTALGLINPNIPAPLFTFLSNVGYSVFAGGVIILLVELPKVISDLLR